MRFHPQYNPIFNALYARAAVFARLGFIRRRLRQARHDPDLPLKRARFPVRFLRRPLSYFRKSMAYLRQSPQISAPSSPSITFTGTENKSARV